MNIVHVIWALNTGGAESMLVDIINEQSKKHEVHLIVVNRSESKSLVDAISNRVTVHRTGRNPGSRNVLQAMLTNIKLLALKPDVVHCHNHELAKYLTLARKLGCRLFLTIHSTGQSTQHLRKYTELFAISEAVKRDVCIRSKRIPVLISNGIRTGKIAKKNIYEYEKICLRLVQIGRLDHYLKGQDIALHAMNCLINERNISNITLDIIGAGPSEDYLTSLSAELGVSHFCNFIGIKSRHWIYNHLCEYDLLIQPSRYEGFGLTVVEALAAKVPVLVSDIEGPMEIINNGQYGFFFESENHNDMVDKILKIKNKQSHQELVKIVEDAYIHSLKMYDVETTALEYVKQYKCIL